MSEYETSHLRLHKGKDDDGPFYVVAEKAYHNPFKARQALLELVHQMDGSSFPGAAYLGRTSIDLYEPLQASKQASASRTGDSGDFGLPSQGRSRGGKVSAPSGTYRYP